MSVFLLFKQKTAYEMRISDWSSDVCSSDLCGVGRDPGAEPDDDGGCGQARRQERRGHLYGDDRRGVAGLTGPEGREERGGAGQSGGGRENEVPPTDGPVGPPAGVGPTGGPQENWSTRAGAHKPTTGRAGGA